MLSTPPLYHRLRSAAHHPSLADIGATWQTGTFQGEQFALFCYADRSSDGWIDVDYFTLSSPPATDAPTARDAIGGAPRRPR